MHHRALHTSLEYANQIDLSFLKDKTSDLENEIKFVSEKEQAFYEKFGVKTFNQFKDLINNKNGLLDPDDKVALNRFTANNLQKSLDQFTHANSDIIGQNVIITLNFDKLREVGFKLKDDYGGSEASFKCTYDANSLKTVFNDIFKDRHFTGEKFTKNLDNDIRNWMSLGMKIEVEEKGRGNKKDRYVEYIRHSIPNFPWGVTKDFVDSAIRFGNESQLYKELEQAISKIKDFIFNELGAGASDDLIEAMHLVWADKFGHFDPATFFQGSKTGNFKSGVQGALGEFQSAILFTYIARKFNFLNQNQKLKISTILGDQYRSGEQGKVDISMLQEFGLQVKNLITLENGELLTHGKEELPIATNIHPDKMAEYLGKEIGTDMLDFIANYYFLDEYQDAHSSDFEDLRSYLSAHIGMVMNMAVQDGIEDTVTFYMINGRYLVPCSAILRAINEDMIAKRVDITPGSLKPFAEEYFKTEMVSRGDGTMKPLAYKYWKHPLGGSKYSWIPTQYNEKEFKDAVSKHISFRTHFNPSSLLKDYLII